MENPITERNIKTFKKSYQKISKEQREEVIRLIKPDDKYFPFYDS